MLSDRRFMCGRKEKHPTQNAICGQLLMSLSTMAAGVSSSVGWPLIQIFDICVERGRGCYINRVLKIAICLCTAFTFWAMLTTTQDPNTSNLAVSVRASHRVPAYGRLCIMLVHSADSLLTDTLILFHQKDFLSIDYKIIKNRFIGCSYVLLFRHF